MKDFNIELAIDCLDWWIEKTREATLENDFALAAYCRGRSQGVLEALYILDIIDAESVALLREMLWAWDKLEKAA